MSSISLHIDLGQDSNFTTSPIRIQATNTREVGRYVKRLEVNKCFELRNRPTNNIFSVKLLDNLINDVPYDEYDYIIKLQFEKIT